jgi:hypothetical protein
MVFKKICCSGRGWAMDNQTVKRFSYWAWNDCRTDFFNTILPTKIKINFQAKVEYCGPGGAAVSVSFGRVLRKRRSIFFLGNRGRWAPQFPLIPRFRSFDVGACTNHPPLQENLVCLHLAIQPVPQPNSTQPVGPRENTKFTAHQGTCRSVPTKTHCTVAVAPAPACRRARVLREIEF